MEFQMMFDAENFWEGILSEDPSLVQAAFDSLPDKEEQEAVLIHLQNMVTEEGWADVQRDSAQFALRILRKQ
jgi:hypothetical protein